MSGIARSASAPAMRATTIGTLPNQRPSGGRILILSGVPQPITSKRVYSMAPFGFITTHEW
jgi:hypothetical protein